MDHPALRHQWKQAPKITNEEEKLLDEL